MGDKPHKSPELFRLYEDHKARYSPLLLANWEVSRSHLKLQCRKDPDATLPPRRNPQTGCL